MAAADGRYHAEDVLVHHADAATGDRSHGQFRMSRHAKLADHEHVHRSPKRPRDFESDRDAAPGKGQHHQIGSAGEMLQLTREDSSSVSSIGKP